jgi:hypothetical protein
MIEAWDSKEMLAGRQFENDLGDDLKKLPTFPPGVFLR